MVEILVVIGIIVILLGASVGGLMKMAKTAEKAKTQELVNNVATALTAMFQQEGVWPKRLAANGATDGRLNAITAQALVAGPTKYFSLSQSGGVLSGHDRFGILTPQGQAAMKRYGRDATLSTKVGTATIEDHILHYALDLDGDGKIIGASVGGESVNVRATAIVWCIGKTGGNNGQPWPYKEGLRKDDVYSWTPGQTKDVN